MRYGCLKLLSVLILGGASLFSLSQAILANGSRDRVSSEAEVIAASERAVVKLVQRGAVVKRFEVREIQTSGLLVRLKPEHLDAAGRIDSTLLHELGQVIDPAIEVRGLLLSDEGLKQLLEKVFPIGLDLSGSRVTDRGLEPLSESKRLRLLDLSFTGITDQGLIPVAKLPVLRHLSVLECSITDQGIATICKMDSLREIFLSKTRVTDAGLRRLQVSLPKCHVAR